MQVTIETELIEKEKIHSLSFKDACQTTQHPNIHEQIKSATRLGNAYRGKVAIYFEDDSGLKRVETTIWAHGARYICLKGGAWIPIDHIIEIRAI